MPNGPRARGGPWPSADPSSASEGQCGGEIAEVGEDRFDLGIDDRAFRVDIVADGPTTRHELDELELETDGPLPTLEDDEDDRWRPVAIKWQNSAHSGLSRDGASGSVAVIVYDRSEEA